MKQLIVLLVCLAFGLTACSQPNDKSNVDVNSAEVRNIEAAEAESEQSVEDNVDTNDNTEQVEDVAEVETITYEYNVPTFDEIFGVSQPALKIFEKDVILGTTTIQDIIGYNQLGDDDKYVSGIKEEIIPPYTAYEFVLENVMYDVTVTLYGYNICSYFMPANMLPVYGAKVNTPNMNESMNEPIFHVDAEKDSIQLEAEDFTFSYKLDAVDEYEASIELILNPKLAVNFMQATKGAYIPKDFENGMELTETQFVVDGKVYDFNEVRYFHMTNFEKFPKLVVVYGDTEKRRTYEFDNECEILVDSDAFFAFQFNDIFNNHDNSIEDMIDLYNLTPEAIRFDIMDQAAHEFKYGEFNSSNMEKGTSYKHYTDKADTTIEYVNNIQGIVTIYDYSSLQEVIDRIKFIVGSN